MKGFSELENRWDIDRGADGAVLPPTIVSPVDGAEMVLVPAGEFTMGIEEKELYQLFILDARENPVFATEVLASRITRR